MKLTSFLRFGILACLAACEQAGSKTADVVQAATKAAAEGGQQLAARLAELANTTPEEARAKAQELVDVAAREVQKIAESDTARRVAAELEAFVDKLTQVKQSLAPKLNVATLQQAIADLIERFKNDPRVASALKSLQEKLQKLAR